ncbi:transketolase C-terminal domain-containing protein [Flavobacterium sp. MDT1-60]|uniref:transketolase C-terminal domain-containing protein n=1 Tax=Flavobacterium sp. MDT1-60 TaxID=1979344 RepID=UPI001CE1B186|nr:transketolase C-terminal domain-containing protein [Flavobacterium sp. MDT1-60]
MKPLDNNVLHSVFSNFNRIITIEEAINGGFGSAVLEFADTKMNIQILGIPDVFIEHGTVNQLQQLCKIDVKSLVNLFSTDSK